MRDHSQLAVMPAEAALDIGSVIPDRLALRGSPTCENPLPTSDLDGGEPETGPIPTRIRVEPGRLFAARGGAVGHGGVRQRLPMVAASRRAGEPGPHVPLQGTGFFPDPRRVLQHLQPDLPECSDLQQLAGGTSPELGRRPHLGIRLYQLRPGNGSAAVGPVGGADTVVGTRPKPFQPVPGGAKCLTSQGLGRAVPAISARLADVFARCLHGGLRKGCGLRANSAALLRLFPPHRWLRRPN